MVNYVFCVAFALRNKGDQQLYQGRQKDASNLNRLESRGGKVGGEPGTNESLNVLQLALPESEIRTGGSRGGLRLHVAHPRPHHL